MQSITAIFNRISNFFRGESQEVKEITGEKEYVFTTEELVALSDYYQYTVKANSKQEAFALLIKYFYGEWEPDLKGKVKSYSSQRNYKNRGFERFTNMPYWFGKLIGGTVREGDRNYREELIEYSKKNNINLKKQFYNVKN